MNDMTDIGLDIESFFYDMFLDDPLSLFITIIEVIAIILVIIRFRNSKKQTQRLEEQQKNLMMLKLTQELTNPLWVEHGGKPDMKVVPFETKWTEAQEDATEGIRVELDIKNSNADRKYTFVVQDAISVGKDDACSITIADNSIEDKHLEFFTENGELMVRKISPKSMAVLERERDYKKLGEKALRVVDKDVIRLGHSELTIEMIS